MDQFYAESTGSIYSLLKTIITSTRPSTRTRTLPSNRVLQFVEMRRYSQIVPISFLISKNGKFSYVFSEKSDHSLTAVFDINFLKH